MNEPFGPLLMGTRMLRSRAELETGEEKATNAAGQRLLWALVVFVATLLPHLWMLPHPGLTWDEPAYLHSARGDHARETDSPAAAWSGPHARCGLLPWLRRLVECRDWEERVRLFSREEILAAWDYNRYGPNFHPPLSGLLSLAGYLLTREWLDELAAWRAASAVELALATAILFAWVDRYWGRWPGLLAAAFLATTPRVAGDAHLFGTDIPTLCIWVLVAAAFWNGLQRRASRLLFGIVLGLAFLTKMNACFVVVPVAIWSLYALARWLLEWRFLLLAGLFLGAALAPLGVAFWEVRRQADVIRLETKRQMVMAALQRLEPGDLVARAAVARMPEEKLEEFAFEKLLLRGQAAGLRLTPSDLHDLSDRRQLAQQLGCPELVLPDYLRYIWVERLSVPSRCSKGIFLLPLIPLGIWLVVGRRLLSWCDRTAGFRQPELLPAASYRSPLVEMFLFAAALAPSVAIGFNPTWWHDTFTQLAHYYQISGGRKEALPDIEIFYLGRKHVYSLPWHNGWVLTGVTAPVPVLAWTLVGCVGGLLDRGRRALTAYFLLHFVTLPVVRMFPVPSHDGVRLMLPTFWFLAAVAGVGLSILLRWAQKWGAERIPLIALPTVAVSVLPCAYELWRIHPYELSYYNWILGGLRGAQRVGFETTYWYDAVTPEVLEQLNDPERGLPPGAFLHPPSPKDNPPTFAELQAMGRLRADLILDRVPDRDFPYMHLLTHSSKSTVFTRLLYAHQPWFSSGWNGVRLFSVYEPASVARAYAMTLLLRARERPQPSLASWLVELATREPSALTEAALLIAERGLAEAASLSSRRRPAVRQVIQWLARQAPDVERLLKLRRQALVEAAEVLVLEASRRPELLRRLVEYEGYLPDAELGPYLGTGLAEVRSAESP
jgi:4-amino-4-deoxy-L-arabinose transferase-like glycosyltransferase